MIGAEIRQDFSSSKLSCWRLPNGMVDPSVLTHWAAVRCQRSEMYIMSVKRSQSHDSSCLRHLLWNGPLIYSCHLSRIRLDSRFRNDTSKEFNPPLEQLAFGRLQLQVSWSQCLEYQNNRSRCWSNKSDLTIMSSREARQICQVNLANTKSIKRWKIAGAFDNSNANTWNLDIYLYRKRGPFF